jgi:hypothetical protein
MLAGDRPATISQNSQEDCSCSTGHSNDMRPRLRSTLAASFGAASATKRVLTRN